MVNTYMSKKTRIISVVLFIIVLAGGMTLWNKFSGTKGNESNMQQGNKQGNKKQALPVNTKIVTYETLQDTYRTKGILLADEEVDLSFETSGKIISIKFSEGSYVKKGTLLAKINDATLQAELKKLEAQLPLSNERVKRQQTLLQRDAISLESFESVTTELDKLKADIESVKARIAYTELRAPFDGNIGLRNVSEGSYVSPTTVISRITKISPLKIEFSVNERQVDYIKKGTALKFNIENDFKNYSANVYAIESSLDEKTLSLKARALYPNKDGSLKPGRSANIEILLHETKNAIVVPAIAVIAERGSDIVYIYQSGKAVQRKIDKGMRTATSVQVIRGIELGDTLITSGVMQLRDGMDVTIN